MKPLLFLSRVAFLYNTCMLLAFVMKYVEVLPEGSIKSTVLIGGLVLSVIGNAVVNVWAGFYVWKRSCRHLLQSRWLFLFNFCGLIFQIYLLLK